MAGVVAGVTRANRQIKIRNQQLPPNKSAYTLKPFDSHFDPNVHNPYFVRRNQLIQSKHPLLPQIHHTNNNNNETLHISVKMKRNATGTNVTKTSMNEDQSIIRNKKTPLEEMEEEYNLFFEVVKALAGGSIILLLSIFMIIILITFMSL